MTPSLTRDRSWKVTGLAHAPAVVGEVIVCAFQSGELRAFSTEGTPVWTTSLPGTLEVGAWNGRPRPAGARVVTQFDRHLLVIEAATGTIASQVEMPGFFEMRQAAIARDEIYLPTATGQPGAMTHTLHARRLPSLDERWSREIGSSLDEMESDGDILCANIDLRRGVISYSASTGDERWRRSIEDLGRGWVHALNREEPGRAVTAPYITPSSVVVGVYQHQVAGLDRSDGAVKWQTRVSMPTPNCQPASDGRVVSVSSRAFAQLDAASGRIIRERSLDDAPPGVGVNPGRLAMSNDLVYAVESDGVVFALDSNTGRVLWHEDIGEKVPLPLRPVLAGGRLFVTDRRGRLHVFVTPKGA